MRSQNLQHHVILSQPHVNMSKAAVRTCQTAMDMQRLLLSQVEVGALQTASLQSEQPRMHMYNRSVVSWVHLKQA